MTMGAEVLRARNTTPIQLNSCPGVSELSPHSEPARLIPKTLVLDRPFHASRQPVDRRRFRPDCAGGVLVAPVLWQPF